MAQEQVPRRESPYVPESGAVGELGQPKATEPGTGYEGKHHGGINIGGERGLNENEHPLQATHDANIGHGHEPLSSTGVDSEYVSPGAGPEAHKKRGVGEKMKSAMKGVLGHKEKHSDPAKSPGKSPRFTDKVKDAVTGQKPGQGAATGYATAGSGVPGDEEYAGKTGIGTGTGTGIGTGHTGIGSGFEHNEHKNADFSSAPRGDQQHQSGWPQPAPPPGIHNLNQVNPSGAPGGEHYSSHPNQVNPSGAPGGGHYPHTGDTQRTGEHVSHPNSVTEGRDGTLSQAPLGEHAGTGNNPNLVDAPRAPGGGHYSTQAADSQKTGEHHSLGEHLRADKDPENKAFDATPGQGYNSGYNPSENIAHGNHGYNPAVSTDHSKYPEPKYDGDAPAGGVASSGYDKRTGASEVGDQHSTRAGPDARHDIPTADNTGTGATYTDPTGAVHEEGPRDDNVKKEGLMAKMMDKLHLGSSNKNSSTNI